MPGGVLTLAALTAAVLSGYWLRLDGTPTGDYVEYLERARAFVRGEALVDAQPLRAIGVSLLHAPAVLLADLLGVELTPWLFAVAAAIHVAIGIGLVLGTARLARALVGAAEDAPPARFTLVGLAAGCVALSSPTFVRFGATAMTDIPAAAALAFGLERALFGPASRGRAAAAGLLLGLSALAAFKTIPLVALAFVALVAVRMLERGVLRGAGLGLVALGPLLALALVQAATDSITYGAFGEGIATYVLINAGQVLAWAFLELGLVDIAGDIYTAAKNAYEEGGIITKAELGSTIDDAGLLAPRDFYLVRFHEFMARPTGAVAGLGVLAGAWAAFARCGTLGPRASSLRAVRLLAPAAIAIAFAAISSVRGSKEMRLWLPILPVFAAYAAVGLRAIAGAGANVRFARPRAAVALGLVVVGAWLGARVLPIYPTRQRAAFAAAAAWLANLESPDPGRPLRAAASYHWAVLFRTPAGVDLTKLPHQLDRLQFLGADAREAALAALAEQDALIVHESLLRAPDKPDDPWASAILDVIARDFGVEAAFWDRTAGSGFGPVLVLTRFRGDGVRRGRIWRVDDGGAARPPDAPRALRYERTLGDVVEVLELTGLRAWRLPGDGLLWVEADLDRESADWVVPHYFLRMGVHRPDGSDGFVLRGYPCYGKSNLVDVPRGARVTNGWLLAPLQGPPDPAGPGSRLSADGPLAVFFDIASEGRDEAGQPFVSGRLEPMDPARGDHAERDDLGPAAPGVGVRTSDDGFVYSVATGALRLGTFERFREGEPVRLERPLSGE